MAEAQGELHVGGRASQDAPAFRLSRSEIETGLKLWVLSFDLPGEKVNKLNEKVMRELPSVLTELERLGQNQSIDALILSSPKRGNFLAGADIELIQAVKTPKDAEDLCMRGHELFNRWEDLPFPTIAAIQGACLGGGCEWALASSAIVMSSDSAAKIGLPEVLLGIFPGLGGTLRLPVRLGIAGALDLILTGKSLSGERAYKAGLADACLSKEGFELQVALWIKKNIKALRGRGWLSREPKLGGMGGIVGRALEKTAIGRRTIFKQARAGVLSKTMGHYPAPLEAIQVIRESGVRYRKRLSGPARASAQRREMLGFGRAATSDVSKNLIRIFFLTEGIKKASGLASGAEAKALPVRAGGVLGAGVMGGGIAQLFAEKGLLTRMKDISVPALSLGVQAAQKIFKKQVKQRRIDERQMLQKMNLISPALDESGFGSLDVVVEAVIEKMEIKKQVLAQLEHSVGDRCVIASNTSSLSISDMQASLAKPERFCGMHFFNPVHRMPLVEVIRGAKTSDHAVTTIFQLAKDLGKMPIVVKDAPGFLVNRLLCPYMNEAAYLVSEGVPIDHVDKTLMGFGMPMGPLELIDEVGTDVGEKVLHILHRAFGDRMIPCTLIEKVVGAKRLGKKSGKGLYVYEGERKTKRLEREIYKIIGVTPKAISLSKEDIVDRCVLPMVNEASRCLEERVVRTPEDVDLGMIMGTGFPPFRGGLLRYADSIGVRKIVTKLKNLEPVHGARFRPDPSLIARANRDAKFYT